MSAPQKSQPRTTRLFVDTAKLAQTLVLTGVVATTFFASASTQAQWSSESIRLDGTSKIGQPFLPLIDDVLVRPSSAKQIEPPHECPCAQCASHRSDEHVLTTIEAPESRTKLSRRPREQELTHTSSIRIASIEAACKDGDRVIAQMDARGKVKWPVARYSIEQLTDALLTAMQGNPNRFANRRHIETALSIATEQGAIELDNARANLERRIQEQESQIQQLTEAYAALSLQRDRLQWTNRWIVDTLQRKNEIANPDSNLATLMSAVQQLEHEKRTRDLKIDVNQLDLTDVPSRTFKSAAHSEFKPMPERQELQQDLALAPQDAAIDFEELRQLRDDVQRIHTRLDQILNPNSSRSTAKLQPMFLPDSGALDPMPNRK